MPNEANQYYSALQYAQKQNQLMGYGTNEKNWDEKQYQETLRDQKNQIRILRAIQAGQNQKPKTHKTTQASGGV